MRTPTILEGSWEALRSRLGKLQARATRKRNVLIFRGQADADWPLSTTLDRSRRFADDSDREEYRQRLLREFRRLASGLVSSPALSELECELLAWHHGLPTPILDWTTSPYIAAFFALDDSSVPDDGHFAIWVLSRTYFLAHEVPEIEIIDDERAISLNPRAIEQRAVFLRVDTGARSVEELLNPGSICFRAQRTDRICILEDLDQSLVNARSLFRDPEGAARTAQARIVTYGESR